LKEAWVDIVVKGRHCEVSERFRAHVEEKLARLEKYDQRIIRVDVEVSQEANPKLSSEAVRIQITIRSKGPVVRAEACAEDKMSALDKAVERLSTQARKAHDRRRVHHGTRTPTSLAQALAVAKPVGTTQVAVDGAGPGQASAAADGARVNGVAGTRLTEMGEGFLVVREKTHPATPMTLDQALYEMELVGHDFFLFIDERDDCPAVVYRRKGYDYGVLRLQR
jgi:ribosomal subunit interface protein